MKKAWRKILVAWCTIAILIMISSVYVSADELIVSTAEEVILETNDTEQPNSDLLSAEGESSELVDEVVQEEDDFR